MSKCLWHFQVNIKWIFPCFLLVAFIPFYCLDIYFKKSDWSIYFRDNSTISSTTKPPFQNEAQKINPKGKENVLVKTILYWDPFYGHPWTNHFGADTSKGLKDYGCPTWNCEFTYDKAQEKNVDAIIFNPYSVQEWTNLERSSVDQIWIWVEPEAPFTDMAIFTEYLIAQTNFSHNFNWTMTYHSSSDLRFEYGYFLYEGRKFQKSFLTPPISTAEVEMNNYLRVLDTNSSLHTSKWSVREVDLSFESAKFSKKQFISIVEDPTEVIEGTNSEKPFKDVSEGENHKEFNVSASNVRTSSWNSFLERPKLIAWMSGHCPTSSKREEYVWELRKYIPVDAFGSCGNLTCGERDPVSIKCWREVLRPNYLFFLGMENTLCDQYVTEKAYNPLMHGLVPVVYGGANYSRFLPPNSFIDARNYHPRDLAKYLIRLQENKEEYGRYHIWRKFWTIHYGQTLCEMCHKLHNLHLYKKQKQDKTNHWNYKRLLDWRLQNEICTEEVAEGLFKADDWRKYIRGESSMKD